jgi:O-antigen ligase
MSFYSGKLYGFWTPVQGGSPFGPFVNRNHFAGWMLMAIPLALGYFCGRVGRGMRMAAPGWRNRIGWLSTPDANETILVAFAILVMAVALTLTTSRSGLLGLALALAMSAWFVARRQQALSRRVVSMVFIGFVLVAAIGWTGVDRLASRFSDPTYGSRVPIWADTLRIARRFPLAGTGLNTYGTSTLAYQTAVPHVHLAQAHNDYLQLVAEGGLLLTIPAAVLAILLVRTIHQRVKGSVRESTDYWIRLGAVTGLVAIALQEIGEFSLQMPGNAVLFVVLLAVAARSRPSDQRHHQHARDRSRPAAIYNQA